MASLNFLIARARLGERQMELADYSSHRPTRYSYLPLAIKQEPTVPEVSPDISLREFQQLIRDMYMQKDATRGIDGTFMWLIEEVGELATALREGTADELAAEFADVLAWLTTIANVAEIDLTTAVRKKYGSGCPGCGQLICTCDEVEKP